uniref:Transposase n=1 Tax=Steinernema glaseri TaxID=37863 RepID=A0A1I7ZEC7_9BILA
MLKKVGSSDELYSKPAITSLNHLAISQVTPFTPVICRCNKYHNDKVTEQDVLGFEGSTVQASPIVG